MSGKKGNLYKKAGEDAKKRQDEIISGAKSAEAVEPPPVVESLPADTQQEKPKRGRPPMEQERVPFTTRVRADVRKQINIAAATYDVKPSDIVDALYDQFFDKLDWDQVGKNRR